MAYILMLFRRGARLARSCCRALLPLALAGGATLSVAESPVEVARAALYPAEGMMLESATLPPVKPGGESRNEAQRKLVRVTASGASDALPTYLVIESVVVGGGMYRYEWGDGCQSIKNANDMFVHRPFHTTRHYCVFAVGPVPLKHAFASFDKSAYPLAEKMGWVPEDGAGYLVHAMLGLETGAFLSIEAYIPEPFAGLPADHPIPADGSRVPGEVVAWAMALGEQVRSSMLSLSGKWQLPPIRSPAELEPALKATASLVAPDDSQPYRVPSPAGAWHLPATQLQREQ